MRPLPTLLAALVAGLAAALPAAAPAQRGAPRAFPSDSAVRALLAPRVASGWTTGLIVGLLEPDGSRRIVAVGTPGGRPLTGASVVEIGSITKALTGILLARMAESGTVALGDPVAKHLPEGWTVPGREGEAITLLDLTTHHSGLPRLPGNLAPRDPMNPYADYDAAKLRDFLAGHALPRDPGAAYEYSNLGAGLLGFALGHAAGTDYERALTSLVLEPLGLRETRLTPTPAMRARLVQGHDADGRPVPTWDLTVLAGAGALRSTTDDMLTFLAANLAASGPMAGALKAAREPRRPAGREGMRVGLGWHIRTKDGRDIVWHNGGTGGFRSFLGFDPARRVGVFVLSASASNNDDLGFHLLDPSTPLDPRASAAPAATVAPEALERHVGTYDLAPTFRLTITREGDALFLQATGQPRVRLWPTSDTTFALRVVDARVTFLRDSTGATTALVLHQNGRDMRAPRGAAAPAPSTPPASSGAPAADAPGERIALDTPTGTIEGTLLLPRDAKGPVPVVLIHAGSGPTDRDGNSAALPGANNSLRLLAEGLAARGIASARYDKRGIGASAGAARAESEMRFDTFVDDAAAWVRRLKGDPRFSTVTVVGHSEGSLIGMLAAERAGADAFVSVAGVGRRADAVLRSQLAGQLPPDLMKESDRILDSLAKGKTVEPVPPQLMMLYRPSVQPYLVSWLKHDPAAAIARLTIPVLVAQGTTDVQVPVSEADLLARAAPRARRLTVEGMNHVLKLVGGDLTAQLPSYGDPSLPVAPALVEGIAGFVKGVGRR